MYTNNINTDTTQGDTKCFTLLFIITAHINGIGIGDRKVSVYLPASLKLNCPASIK